MDLRTLLRPWLREAVVLDSVQPPRALLEGMVSEVVPSARGEAGFPFQPKDGFTLVDRISDGEIVVMASRGYSRNAWRPSLNGRLEEEGRGARFVGTIGMPSWVLTASGVLLTLIALFAVFASSAGWGSAVSAAVAVFVISVVLMNLGAYVGAKERDLLLTWLTARLGSAEPRSSTT